MDAVLHVSQNARRGARRPRGRGIALAAAVSAAIGLGAAPAAAFEAVTTRVSVASDGTQGNGASATSSISADGRFVVFGSSAANLVPGDSNGLQDIFVHDRREGTTARVSVASEGTQANGLSFEPSISADGRFVAFQSRASNLVPDDTNDPSRSDVFVHDLQNGTTTRVSVSSDGAQSNGTSGQARISADGRFVAFHSDASTLVPGDGNGFSDVFVHDREEATTTRVSVTSDGTEASTGVIDPATGQALASLRPSISADGRFVAFMSYASDLVAGDANGDLDVFVHDRLDGTTTLVSVASDGAQGNDGSPQPTISADGRFVAFHSFASNLVPGDTNGTGDVFVRDRQLGTTRRLSVSSDGLQANDISFQAAISADGRYVAFMSIASNLVGFDTNRAFDVFVHDRQSARTTRASVTALGTQAISDSGRPALSADGRYVAFDSFASNLVRADTNRRVDVFVHDREGMPLIAPGAPQAA